MERAKARGEEKAAKAPPPSPWLTTFDLTGTPSARRTSLLSIFPMPFSVYREERESFNLVSPNIKDKSSPNQEPRKPRPPLSHQNNSQPSSMTSPPFALLVNQPSQAIPPHLTNPPPKCTCPPNTHQTRRSMNQHPCNLPLANPIAVTNNTHSSTPTNQQGRMV